MHVHHCMCANYGLVRHIRIRRMVENMGSQYKGGVYVFYWFTVWTAGIDCSEVS